MIFAHRRNANTQKCELMTLYGRRCGRDQLFMNRNCQAASDRMRIPRAVDPDGAKRPVYHVFRWNLFLQHKPFRLQRNIFSLCRLSAYLLLHLCTPLKPLAGFRCFRVRWRFLTPGNGRFCGPTVQLPAKTCSLLIVFSRSFT